MSIEDLLRQKAAAKEDERLQQENDQRAVADKAERLQQQEAKESRLGGLRQSITDIDTKIGQMQSLLNELKQAHEQAKTSVVAAKKEGHELAQATAEVNKLFTNEQFRALLAGEGIESIDDLLLAEEYSEQDQVKSVKGLRKSREKKYQAAHDQIGEIRQAKVEAQKAITAEKPDVTQKLSYKDVVTALEELVQDLGNERKKLYYQTPEGQEALKAEILDRVKKRCVHNDTYYNFASAEVINKHKTITKGDIEDSSEYGKEKVKDAVKNYYGEVIDNKLAEEEQNNGQTRLREAVETLENLPKRWRENRKALQELQSARRATIDRLAKLLGNDRQTPLFQQVNNSGHWNHNNPQELAETFVDANAGYNTSSLGLGAGAETPDKILEGIVSEQEKFHEPISEENIQNAFSRQNVSIDRFSPALYRHETIFDNPERVAIILAEQAEFYRKFQAALTTPEEVLAKTKTNPTDLYKEIRTRSEEELGLGHGGRIKRRLDFDGKTFQTLRDTPLYQIKADLERRQKALESTAKTLKEQISYKVDVDWDFTELSAFLDSRDNLGIVQEAVRIVKVKKIAEVSSPRFDLVISGLQEQMEMRLTIDYRGQLSFDSIPKADAQRVQKRFDGDDINDLDIDALLRSIQRVEVNMRSIDERAVSEGNGLFRGKRKQREQEKDALDIQKQAMQERLTNLQAENELEAKMDKKLNGIRAWIDASKTDGLELKLPNGSVPLQELVDNIKGQMNVQLTPEQSKIYEQYQVLKEKQKKTAEQYVDRWKLKPY